MTTFNTIITSNFFDTNQQLVIEVNALKERNQTLQDRVDQLESDSETFKQTISAQQDQIHQQNETIAELKSILENEKNTNADTSLERKYFGSSAFVNWCEEQPDYFLEEAIVFQSLVATIKSQPALDDFLKDSAVIFLESVVPKMMESIDAFLRNFVSSSDASYTNFMQSVKVLLSSPYQTITTAAMKMLQNLVGNCSPTVTVSLIKADLIPQLITTLNPLSLSFAAAANVHTCLISIVKDSFSLATSNGLDQLESHGFDGQDYRETVLKQVLAPSEQYIRRLCVNRYSIVDGGLSNEFIRLLAYLLRISLSYQPTMELLLDMPVFLTVPSCLEFFDHEHSIWIFLFTMDLVRWNWNRARGEERQIWKIMHRMLRKEGIEDVMKEKLQNAKNGRFSRSIVDDSIMWNNLLGMNLNRSY